MSERDRTTDGRRAALVLLAITALAGCGDEAPTMDAAATCEADADCDDGRFCNGAETCDPSDTSADERGCVPRERPCMPSQSCIEDADTCETACDRELDADADGHDAIACGGDDCDDADPQRYPGNVEVCDGAAHDEDCNPSTFGDRDLDGDGRIDARCCNGDACGDDCDDLAPGVSPTATETCDAFDNDCDGVVDEGVLVDGFADEDGDGRGDPAAPRMACPGSPGFSTFGDDCDDEDLTRNGGQVEICDTVDNDCDETVDESPTAVTWYRDGDGDGFGNATGGTVDSCAPVLGHSLLGTDCDDSRRGVSPVGVERCNGRDDDCNGAADFLLGVNDSEDDDGDGVPDIACVGFGTDCGDDDSLAGPGIPELCRDMVDNDCDGLVDEDAPAVEWLPDLDGDGFGDPVGPVVTDCARQPGRAPRGGDCDDSSSAVRPTGLDGCDGVDEDCDGLFDEDAAAVSFYEDLDGDGFGAGTAVLACRGSAGLSSLGNDCDDFDASRFPGATETCDVVDEDCDGAVDEDSLRPVYLDDDGDGFGDDATVSMACDAGPGRSLVGGDCDDDEASAYPMAAEVCDLLDNDCDGTTDEMTLRTVYVDADGDGFGDAAMSSMGCGGGTGEVSVGGDCDDADPTAFPMATESCDGVDDDCDSAIDEGTDLRCASGGTMAACVDGGCIVTGCGMGFADCDGLTPNGCERDVTSDPSACGGCATRCAVGAECTTGACERDVIALSAGQGHQCLIWSTQQVVCWGSNGDQALGVAGSGTVPEGVLPPLMATEIVTYDTHSCARSRSGWQCWGRSETDNGTAYSLVGDGVPYEELLPTPVAVSGYTDLALGNSHACAVRPDQTVHCWGANESGQLGDGTTTDRLTAVTVAGVSDAVAVAAGLSHSCALRSGGTIACWGSNTQGQLGDGTSSARLVPVFDVVTVAGDPTSTLTGVVDIAASDTATCAITAAGESWCWGRGENTGTNVGSLGERRVATRVVDASLAPIPATAVDIDSGASGFCARMDDGTDSELWCWGRIARGDGTNSTQVTAAKATGLTDVDLFAVGNGAVIVRRRTGQLVAWGTNGSGDPLGVGAGTYLAVPTPVVYFP